MGSVVSLATGDPDYNGVYTILDTGPKLQGRLLDLYLWSCNDALEFGRRRIEVTVLRLGWDPRASSPSLVDRLFRRRELARRTEESRTEKPDAEDAAAPSPPEPSEGSDGCGPETQPPGASTPPDAATPFVGVDPSAATPAPAAAVPPAP